MFPEEFAIYLIRKYKKNFFSVIDYNYFNRVFDGRCVFILENAFWGSQIYTEIQDFCFEYKIKRFDNFLRKEYIVFEKQLKKET